MICICCSSSGEVNGKCAAVLSTPFPQIFRSEAVHLNQKSCPASGKASIKTGNSRFQPRLAIFQHKILIEFYCWTSSMFKMVSSCTPYLCPHISCKNLQAPYIQGILSFSFSSLKKLATILDSVQNWWKISPQRIWENMQCPVLRCLRRCYVHFKRICNNLREPLIHF